MGEFCENVIKMSENLGIFAGNFLENLGFLGIFKKARRKTREFKIVCGFILEFTQILALNLGEILAEFGDFLLNLSRIWEFFYEI